MPGKRCARLWVCAFLLQTGVSFAVAQASTATLTGRVSTTGGTGIPGVVVSVRSAEQPGGSKQAITDAGGAYRISLLLPARDYVVRVSYPGFAPVEAGPLHLGGGKTVTQDVTLRSDAETTETIVVESRGSIVDTESTRTSTSYNAEFIEGLPIFGRSYQDILTLAPGVTDTDGDGNPNVHGARDTGLQYRLDGGNITNPFTGKFGQELNAEMIEEVEIITSGASAEYGRADGGFTNIITKSGGNDFEGSFKLYWRGHFLDGNGAGHDNIFAKGSNEPARDVTARFSDLRPTLTLGGAVVKDRLWYFGTVEIVDTETPKNILSTDILVRSRGSYSFAKLSWQPDLSNKLALQMTADPRTFEGLGLSLGVAPESDYTLKLGSFAPQLKWTSTLSPALLLESSLTSYRGRVQIEPVSPDFKPTPVTLQVVGGLVQALYPCGLRNCWGDPGLYRIHQLTGLVSGPYNLESDQKSRRNALKSDLSWTHDGALGQHNIRSGFEFQEETFEDRPVTNAVLFDNTLRNTRLGTGAPEDAYRVNGFQILLTYEPLATPQSAAGFNSGAYLLDSWKPRPNLSLNLGVRLDREDIDTSGYLDFDPRAERRSSVGLWRAICSAADNLDRATLDYSLVTKQNCYSYNDHPMDFDGRPSNFGASLPLNHPDYPILDPRIRELDLDGNGALASTGAEGDAIMARLTTFFERQTSNFAIVNSNLAPRLSVSWDPRADGRTKIFSTWGWYYDRLFLSTVAQEIGPDRISYAFTPDATQVIRPGTYSRLASQVSVTQTDRDLRTPRTEEITIGLERELAPEWSVGATWIRRRGRDLLQDADMNHITCPQHGMIGVSPEPICSNGEELNYDRFGDVGGRIGHFSTGMVGGIPGFNAAGEGARTLPNGAPDLYTVNYNFNEILKVGNFNSYEFEAWEVKLVKRLHRNWQMQVSYTWSEAFGQAEAFVTTLGNDPETLDDEEGHLAYDQQHVLKFQAVTRLPHGLSLGTAIQWSSGTPWSILRRHSELDSTGNIIVRTFYPSGQRNDQRNEGAWILDGRVEKRFTIGSVEAAASLSVNNLLNADSLTILSLNQAIEGGAALYGSRDFGRRFELGTTFRF